MSHHFPIKTLEVTLPKQKLDIFRRCQIYGIKILIQNYITRLENARLSIGQMVWRLSHVQGPARMRSSERPTSEGCGETLTGFREEGEQDEGKVRGR